MCFFIKILKKFYIIYRNFCKRKRVRYYLRHGQKPWSRGYHDFLWQLVEKTINNSDLINRFKNSFGLPTLYGKNIGERIIEYPWLISNLPEEPKTLLDAGSTLNYSEIMNHKKLNNKKIIIVNLSHEDYCFWQKDISYLFADLRQLPFLDNCFDIITCISTLEHVGMDNTMFYTDDPKHKESKSRDYLKVILELKRVLKSGGTLFITVPFGRYQNLQYLQQFNQDMIKQVIETFNGKTTSIDYYRYTKDGWNISNADECMDMEFFDIHQTKYRNKNSNKDYDPDFAAAARAVACIKLTK